MDEGRREWSTHQESSRDIEYKSLLKSIVVDFKRKDYTTYRNPVQNR